MEFKRSDDADWTVLSTYPHSSLPHIPSIAGLQQFVRYDVRVTCLDPDAIHRKILKIPEVTTEIASAVISMITALHHHGKMLFVTIHYVYTTGVNVVQV